LYEIKCYLVAIKQRADKKKIKMLQRVSFSEHIYKQFKIEIIIIVPYS